MDFFELLHPYFLSLMIQLCGLISNLGSLYTHKNFEQHPMNHIFSVSWCQSNLAWGQNFWVFGMSIFEKLQFSTYMDMHINWKPKSFWIHIFHQKVWLSMKTFWKKNSKSFTSILKEKKIWRQNFQSLFFNTTKILIQNDF